MSDKSQKLTQEQKDAENFNPDNLIVNIGGRLVPFSLINKPHHAIVHPKEHHAPIDAKDFPDLEPEAKEREAKLAAAKKSE